METGLKSDQLNMKCKTKQSFIQILKDRDVTYDYYKYIQLDLKSQRKNSN